MRHNHGLRASLGAAADANLRNTVLLLSGDGTNGAQNNTFIDSSINNFSITRTGNATQGTFSPFGNRWSIYFDGNEDYLTIPSSAALGIGTGQYTVELWVYLTASVPFGVFIAVSNGLQFSNNPSGNICIAHQNVAFELSSNTSVPLNQWAHLAACRDSGSVTRLFLNGSQIAEGPTGSNYQQGEAYVNRNPALTTSGFNTGYYSNLRVLKGTALYTSSFLPPTSPLTAIANTSLLACQSNRFSDSSSNNLSVTRFGDARVEAFGPFSPATAYNASTHGGSGYFDGNGDRIYCTPSNLGGQFTIEGWWYANSLSQNPPVFFGNWATGCLLRYSGGRIEWYTTATNASTPYTLTTGQWYHMAVTRDSSGVQRVFANGVQLFSVTSGASISMTNFCIGSENLNSGGVDIWNGYISGFRILNGTCLYSSSFTPPTSPPTAIANTDLLVNFTSGSVIDATRSSVLETIGNAQTSATQKKFGTGALYFDGNADWLIAQPNGSFAFGTGDFTVEAWIYQISQNLYSSLAEIGNHLYSNAVVFLVGTHSGAALYAGGFYGTGTLTTNQWQHVAWVRSSGTLKIFVDGINTSTTAFTNNLTDTSSVAVGYAPGYGGGPNYYMNGYIDDLRITKGVARYTANFTPPSSAFPLS